MPDLTQLQESVHEAGRAILSMYQKTTILSSSKEDGSPVTEADTQSHLILTHFLRNHTALPIVSEEDPIKQNYQEALSTYWLVDPLDGTRDFLAKNDEFSINIALIEHTRPSFGLIYFPAKKTTYWAFRDQGAYKNGNRINASKKSRPLIGTVSHFYATNEEELFFEKYNVKTIIPYGASLKFCKLAEGAVDVYPRLHGSSEWDTAAGQLLAAEAGCQVIDMNTQKEMIYQKPTFRNPSFLAFRNDLSSLFL